MIVISKDGNKIYTDSKMYIEIIGNNITVNGETFGEYECVGLAKRALYNTTRNMIDNGNEIFNLNGGLNSLTPEEEREINSVLAKRCNSINL